MQTTVLQLDVGESHRWMTQAEHVEQKLSPSLCYHCDSRRRFLHQRVKGLPHGQGYRGAMLPDGDCGAGQAVCGHFEKELVVVMEALAQVANVDATLTTATVR